MVVRRSSAPPGRAVRRTGVRLDRNRRRAGAGVLFPAAYGCPPGHRSWAPADCGPHLHAVAAAIAACGPCHARGQRRGGGQRARRRQRRPLSGLRRACQPRAVLPDTPENPEPAGQRQSHGHCAPLRNGAHGARRAAARSAVSPSGATTRLTGERFIVDGGAPFLRAPAARSAAPASAWTAIEGVRVPVLFPAAYGCPPGHNSWAPQTAARICTPLRQRSRPAIPVTARGQRRVAVSGRAAAEGDRSAAPGGPVNLGRYSRTPPRILNPPVNVKAMVTAHRYVTVQTVRATAWPGQRLSPSGAATR